MLVLRGPHPPAPCDDPDANARAAPGDRPRVAPSQWTWAALRAKLAPGIAFGATHAELEAFPAEQAVRYDRTVSPAGRARLAVPAGRSRWEASRLPGRAFAVDASA